MKVKESYPGSVFKDRFITNLMSSEATFTTGCLFESRSSAKSSVIHVSFFPGQVSLHLKTSLASVFSMLKISSFSQ